MGGRSVNASSVKLHVTVPRVGTDLVAVHSASHDARRMKGLSGNLLMHVGIDVADPSKIPVRI